MRSCKKTDPWEYLQFQTQSDLETTSSEVSLVEPDIEDTDWLRASERKYPQMMEEAVDIGLLPSPAVIDSLKYEPPLVKELRQLHVSQLIFYVLNSYNHSRRLVILMREAQ